MQDDPAIAAVREVRHRISQQYGHDPKKLIAYYIQLQEIHKDRLLEIPYAPNGARRRRGTGALCPAYVFATPQVTLFSGVAYEFLFLGSFQECKSFSRWLWRTSNAADECSAVRKIQGTPWLRVG